MEHVDVVTKKNKHKTKKTECNLQCDQFEEKKHTQHIEVEKHKCKYKYKTNKETHKKKETQTKAETVRQRQRR